MYPPVAVKSHNAPHKVPMNPNVFNSIVKKEQKQGGGGSVPFSPVKRPPRSRDAVVKQGRGVEACPPPQTRSKLNAFERNLDHPNQHTTRSSQPSQSSRSSGHLENAKGKMQSAFGAGAKHKSYLAEAFRSFDSNANGTCDWDEFEAGAVRMGLSRDDAATLLVGLDPRGTGEVSTKAFVGRIT
jgi:hypothetical protein